MHASGTMSQYPYPWSFCKIHVSGYITRPVSQDHPQEPGRRILYTRPTSPDPRLRILYKVHSSGPSARFMPPGPCLRIYVSASLSVYPLQDPCLLDPIQGPCLRIYASASASLNADPLQDPCLRILCKTHVSFMSPTHASASMSQRPYLWSLYARPALLDLCLSIHVCGSDTRSMSPDPNLRVR